MPGACYPPGMSKRAGFDLFSVGGVRVAIDASWLIIFALVLWSLSAGYFPRAYPGYSPGEYWLIGLLATSLFFASVVLHELAHALVANRLGQRVRRITWRSRPRPRRRRRSAAWPRTTAGGSSCSTAGAASGW